MKLNKLSEKVEVISTKGLTKDLINKYSILNGTKYFSSDGLKNDLVFIPASRRISTFSRTNKIYSGKSKGMSEESIKNPSTSDNSFAPKWIFGFTLSEVKFHRYYLKQDSVYFLQK